MRQVPQEPTERDQAKANKSSSSSLLRHSFAKTPPFPHPYQVGVTLKHIPELLLQHL